MNNEPILHHYEGSPFAEKARLMFGFKRLAWRSVHIPVVTPKPDLVALTGGYRKTPVLQIGADVYCDTLLIAARLEQLAPEPAFVPPQAPLAPLLAQWADSVLFWTVMPYATQPAGLAALFAGAPPGAVQAFAADRSAFTAGMKRVSPGEARAALPRYLAALERQLGAQAFLFGDAPCIADLAVVHPLWFLRRAGPMAAILQQHARFDAWIDRTLAIGHGTHSRLRAAEALDAAAGAAGHAPTRVEAGQGHEAGQLVTVSATDYGRDAVAGELIGLDADEIVLRRDDARAGTVHVHFPRIGFQLRTQETHP